MNSVFPLFCGSFVFSECMHMHVSLSLYKKGSKLKFLCLNFFSSGSCEDKTGISANCSNRTEVYLPFILINLCIFQRPPLLSFFFFSVSCFWVIKFLLSLYISLENSSSQKLLCSISELLFFKVS
ncbi:hypothetical protein S83_010236 [Arachis hypogaea]